MKTSRFQIMFVLLWGQVTQIGGNFMKKKIMKLVLSLSLLSVAFLDIQTPINVRAERDTTIEAGLEIDESVGELTGLFDSIGRFSKDGIAKIMKTNSVTLTYDNGENITYSFDQYGLINLNGYIVLDPIYDSISDYNDTYWLITKKSQFFEEISYHYEGLVSKETGEIILEPKYDFIPDTANSKILFLRYKVDEYSFQDITVNERTDVKSNKNGIISDVVLPTNIDLTNHYYVYVNYVEKQLVMAGYGSSFDGENQITNFDSWLVDEHGDRLVDFSFDQPINVYTRDDNTIFLLFANDVNPSNGKGNMGLIKIYNNNGIMTYEMIISEHNEFSDFWFNPTENRLYYTIVENEQNVQGYYDYETEQFSNIDEAYYGSVYSMDIPSTIFNDLTIRRDCVYDAQNTSVCTYGAYQKGSNIDILDGHVFDQYTENNVGFISFAQWRDGSPVSNFIYKDTQGTLKLYSETDLQSYIFPSTSSLIKSQSFGTSQTTSLYNLKNGIVETLFSNEVNAYYWVNDNIADIEKRITDTNGQHTLRSLFDLEHNRFILTDVSELSYDRLVNDGETIFYGYFKTINQPDNQLFVYHDDTLTLIENAIGFIGQFEYGIIKVRQEQTYICLSSEFDPDTGSYIQVEKTCTRVTEGIISSKGEFLVSGADSITLYPDQYVAVAQMSHYNAESKSFDSHNLSYIYLNHLVDGSQESVVYEGYDHVEKVSDDVFLMTHNNASPRFEYAKNGVLLTSLNAAISQAVSVGIYSEGSLLFTVLDESGFKTIFYDVNNTITELVGVTSFVGKIVKIGTSLYYVDNDNDDFDLSPQLTALDGVLSQEIENEILSGVNFTRYSEAVYSFSRADFTLGLISTALINGERQFNLIQSQSFGSVFCEIIATSDNQILEVVQNENPGNSACDYSDYRLNRKVGLISKTGEMIIEPAYYQLSIYDDLIIAIQNTIDEEDPSVIVKTSSLLNRSGMDAFDSMGLGIPNRFDSVSKTGFILNAVKDGTNYMFVSHDGAYDFVGNVTADIYQDGFARYHDLTSNPSVHGLIDPQGNIVIDLTQGYESFRIDLVNQLISAQVFEEYGYQNQGLYDFNGQLLLDENYRFEWVYDQADPRFDTLGADANGYIKVSVKNTHINTFNYFWSEDSSQVTYQEVEANLYNYYNVVTHSFIFDSFIVNEEVYSDGYTKAEVLVRTDLVGPESYNGNVRFYVYDDGNERYWMVNKSVMINPQKELITNVGQYDFINWNVNTQLVTVATCLGTDEYGYARFGYGLITKEGSVKIQPIYQNIYYWREYDLYTLGLDVNGNYLMGIADYDGTLILEAKNTISFELITDFGFLWIFADMEIQDLNHEGETFVVQTNGLFDLKTKKMIIEGCDYIDNYSLLLDGSVIIRKYTGEGRNQTYVYYDEFGNELIDSYNEAFYKYGVLSADGTVLAQPIYEQVETILGPNGNEETYKGIYKVALITEVIPCTDTYYDYYLHEIVTVDYDYGVYMYGLVNATKGWFIEPEFHGITVGDNGYAITRVGEFEVHEYTQYIEEIDANVTSFWVGMRIKTYGLVNMQEGEILQPIYSQLTSTYPGRSTTSVPYFDGDGLIRVNKAFVDESQHSFNGVGLADKNGVVIEPLYKEAYLKNGYYYLNNFDGTWLIRNTQDPIDETLINRIGDENSQILSIEMVGNYLIVQNEVTNEVESYFQYGVLNKDLSAYLPFDYTSISFDGTYWYLEKYDPITGSYPREVLDINLNVIIAATSKYDSLSEFVGGYAIGQSGTKAEPIVTLDLNFSALSMLVESQDFVLEIIDAQGKVVGDLSQEYESATLIGISDGKIKALVKKDGLFYIATLVTREVVRDTTPPIITIDPYTLLETSENIVVTAQTNEGSLNQTSFTFTENGSFTFIATDDAGNVSEVTVTITNIVKTKSVNYAVSGLGGSLSAIVNASFIPSGSKHPIGSTITFSAAPNAGWIITQWNQNGLCLTALDKTIIVSSLSEDLSVTVEFGLLGDLNLDGATTKTDLSIFAKVMAGKIKLTGKALMVADMNRDGSVTAADLSKLSKLLTTLK